MELRRNQFEISLSVDGGVADRSIGLLGIIHHYIISLADVAAPSTVQDGPEVQQMLLQATPPIQVSVSVFTQTSC